MPTFKANYLTWVMHMRKLPTFEIIRISLVKSFPLIFLASVLTVIQTTLLSSDGFLVALLGLGHWVTVHQPLVLMTAGLAKLILIVAQMMVAHQTANQVGQVSMQVQQLGGSVAALGYLFLTVKVTKTGFQFNAIFDNLQGFTWAILVGLLTGYCFRWLSHPVNLVGNVTRKTILAGAFDSLIPAGSIVLILIGVKYSLIIMRQVLLNNRGITKLLAASSYQPFDLIMMCGLIFLIQLSIFLGLGGFGPTFNQGEQSVNLTMALKQHSAWQVPYPLTFDNLYHSFGMIGGSGMLLGLVLVMVFFIKNKTFQTLGKIALGPACFNAVGPIMVGLPIFYVSLYLIPFVMAPIISVILAWGAITLHLIPVPVYPVPTGTPGLLVAFIGTGGNIRALILSLICLGISMVLYYPFIKLEIEFMANTGIVSPLSED